MNLVELEDNSEESIKLEVLAILKSNNVRLELAKPIEDELKAIIEKLDIC